MSPRLILGLLFLLLAPAPAWAAVAFSNGNFIGAATGSTFQYPLTVSASSPGLVTCVALASTTATVTSVTWSVGGQTLTPVTSLRSIDDYVAMLVLPAPTPGTGTINVTLSAAVPYQSATMTYTGVHASTPVPGGDVQTSTAVNTSDILTPTNLTGSDASVGCGALTVAGDTNGVLPNSRFNDLTTAVNLEMGDALGTGSLTFTWSNTAGRHAMIAARLVSAQSDVTPPSVPTNLVGVAVSSEEIDLTWTASTDDIGVLDYRIERCVTSSCSFVEIGTSLTPAFNDPGRVANTNYTYRVRAEDAALNLSGYSTSAAATTLGIQFLVIRWTDLSTAPEETSFVLQRKSGVAGTYADLVTVAGVVGAGSTVAYTDAAAPRPTACYRVRATNSGGDSGYSNEGCATFVPPPANSQRRIIPSRRR